MKIELFVGLVRLQKLVAKRKNYLETNFGVDAVGKKRRELVEFAYCLELFGLER